MKYCYIILIFALCSCCGKVEEVEKIRDPFEIVDSISKKYVKDTIPPIRKLNIIDRMKLNQEKRDCKKLIRKTKKEIKCIEQCGCKKNNDLDNNDLDSLKNLIEILNHKLDSIRNILEKNS